MAHGHPARRGQRCHTRGWQTWSRGRRADSLTMSDAPTLGRTELVHRVLMLLMTPAACRNSFNSNSWRQVMALRTPERSPSTLHLKELYLFTCSSLKKEHITSMHTNSMTCCSSRLSPRLTPRPPPGWVPRTFVPPRHSPFMLGSPLMKPRTASRNLRTARPEPSSA